MLKYAKIIFTTIRAQLLPIHARSLKRLSYYPIISLMAVIISLPNCVASSDEGASE